MRRSPCHSGGADPAQKKLRIIPAPLCGAALFAAVACYTAAAYIYWIPAQALDGKTIEASVQVVEEPDGARCTVRVKSAEVDGEPVRVPGKIVCYIYGETLRPYDIFDATLTLRLPGAGSRLRRERADGVFLYADVQGVAGPAGPAVCRPAARRLPCARICKMPLPKRSAGTRARLPPPC